MARNGSGFGGIVLHFGNKPLIDGFSASSQHEPKRFYVYGHYDPNGALFYVGKGTGRRAWSYDDRHVLWHRYVERRCRGNFSVRILADDLMAEDAEILESSVMMEKGGTLVNWANWGRRDDYQAIDSFHRLRNMNRFLCEKAWKNRAKLESSLRTTEKCVARIREYAFIVYQGGLVGELLREENAELGWSGDMQVLGRHIALLLKAGRTDEASRSANNYFSDFKRDATQRCAIELRARIERAQLRAVKRSPRSSPQC